MTKNLPETTIDKGRVILERLYDNPIVKGLLQLVPGGYGSGLVEILDDQVSRLHKKRTKIFFDELANNKIEITEELIEDNDFLHCFFSTIRAVLRTHKNEKIKYLARLFGKQLTKEAFKNIDEFESFLESLDHLNEREIKILKTLYDFERLNGVKGGDSVISRLRINSDNWEGFIEKVHEETEIPKEEINDVLIMTERSGFYVSSRPHARDLRKQSGTTTPSFNKLVKIIFNQN